jgi:hypothetical protein
MIIAITTDVISAYEDGEQFPIVCHVDFIGMVAHHLNHLMSLFDEIVSSLAWFCRIQV